MSTPAARPASFQPQYREPNRASLPTYKSVYTYIAKNCQVLVDNHRWTPTARWPGFVAFVKAQVKTHAFERVQINGYTEKRIPSFFRQPPELQLKVVRAVQAQFPETGLFFDSWPIMHIASLYVRVSNSNDRAAGVRGKASTEEIFYENARLAEEFDKVTPRTGRKFILLLLVVVFI